MKILIQLVIGLLFFVSFVALAENYSPPRTASGKPVLQGYWTNSSITRLERPDNIQSLVLTEKEALAMAAKDPLANRVIDDAKPTDPNAGLLDGKDLLAGRGYNSFWLDPGMQVAKVKGEYRSSWIVVPKNGKIPFSEKGKEYVKKSAEYRNDFSGPEIRPLGERCLATTGRTGPPMISGLYNNHYQIVQTDDHFIFLSEMVQHGRVVTLNGKHPPASVKLMFGHSIGWWEGDTLVVETTNFHPMHTMFAHPLFHTDKSKVTERLSRYADDELLYEWEIEDPNLYTQKWRGESVFKTLNEPIFEFSCHEGNMSLPGILKGARVQEAN